ncbi:MAG TPA: DUF6044 family protein, partial [Candidatus Limnocylindrales bacterium]
GEPHNTTDERPGPAIVIDRFRSIAGGLERWPWIVYAFAAVLAYPITEMLLAGESASQYAHDVFDDDIPRLFSIAADWKAFGPSFWDPHLTSGNALFAQFALPPTAPDVVLSFLVPPFLAFAINSALMAFAAGWGMHLFLRDSLRLRSIACFAGGLIATFAFWQYILGYAALLLPLVLWTTDRALASEPGQRRHHLIAIAVVAFLFLSSLLQIVLIDGVVALIYVLATSAGVAEWPHRVRRLVGIWAGAGLLAAPVLLAVILAVPGSQRAIWDLPVVTVGQAVNETLHRYAEIVLGVRTVGTFGGSADIYGSFFPGAIALPFLAVSLVVPRPSRRLRFALGLLLAIPVADLIATLAASPLVHVPLIGSFQFVRVRHLVPVLVAINVAIGISAATSPGVLAWLSHGRRRLGLAVFGIALVAVGFEAIAALRHVRRPPADPQLAAGWLLAAGALIGGAVIVGAAVVLVAGNRPRIVAGGGGRFWAAIGLLLLVSLAGERLVFSRAERDLDGRLGTWSANVTPTAALAFIAAQPGPGRVLSIGAQPNRGLTTGLDMVDGYETIYPLRYHELFGGMIAPHLDLDPTIYRYFHAWGNRAYAFGPELSRPIANLLGVRWLQVAGQTLTDPTLLQRFQDGNTTVYENGQAFPRAFIVHAATVVPDRAALIAVLGRATSDDLRNRVYLAASDPGAALVAGAGSTSPAADDTASIVTDTPDDVVVRSQSGASGILVLADTYDDGWAATIDGSPAAILPVDDALRGVAIPAGDHMVAFNYRPLPVIAGFAGSFITTLILVLYGCGAHRRLRRANSLPR